MLRSAGKQSVDSVESVSQRCLAPLRCQQAISLVKMPPAAAAAAAAAGDAGSSLRMARSMHSNVLVSKTSRH